MNTPETDLRQSVIREVQTLPEDQLPGVLDYLRFLRIKSLSGQELEDRFTAALNAARAIARQEGITEEDIAREIAQVRANP